MSELNKNRNGVVSATAASKHGEDTLKQNITQKPNYNVKGESISNFV
jgi:hypothetical protein